MRDTRILSEDSLTGIRRLHHYDSDTDQVTIQTQQVIDDVLEATTTEHRMHDERANWKGDMHRVASLPAVIYWDLKKKGIIDNDKALRKWLNGSDGRLFRTRPGRV